MGEVDDFMWKGGMVLVIYAGGQSRALPLRGGDAKGRYKEIKREIQGNNREI